MKKVLSFVLVLSMILGSFGMAFAGNAQSDALSVLSGLGVFAGYTDGSMGEDKVVTRAEAATLIIKAMDLQDYAVGKTTFTDMDQAKWAEPFVAYAVSLGFVKGNTDGTFAPNATVTSDQMITMLVQAIGYKAEYLTGGYPGAFVNTAKALGILEGVKSGAEGCTRGDVAQMIYNALEVPFVSYDSEGALQYTVLKGEVKDCFMERLIADLDKETKVVEGDEDSKINLKPYQGAYATLIKDGDDVVAVDDIESVFVTGEYDAEEGVFVAEDDKEYKLTKLDSTTAMYFENGDKDGTKDLTATTDEVVVAVEISGKYFTELYSIAAWKADGEFQADEKDIEKLAEDDLLDGKAFIMTDEDEIDTDEFVLLGVEALADIEEEDIVTYYLNTEDKVVKVEVGTEVVEGTVKKINAAGDEVTINGKKYDVAMIEGSVDLGDEGEFFLNYAGEIAAFEGVSTVADDYAIVTVKNQKTGDEFDGEEMKIKMITADGKEAIYVIEEDYAEELTSAGAVFAADTVIVYNLDKNGEIDKMEAVELKDAQGELSAKDLLDGYYLADEVVVFEVEDGDYTLVDLKAVPVKEDLKNTKFALNDDDEIAFILLDAEAGEDAESVYAVVTGSVKTTNEDDDKVWEVYAMVDGKEVDPAYLTTSLSVEVPTDIVLYEVEFDGEAVAKFTAVTAETEDAAVATATVSAINKAGVIETAAAKYEVAEDVVVYFVDEDGDFDTEKAYSITDIEEEDTVVLYDVNVEDEDGYDFVIFY